MAFRRAPLGVLLGALTLVVASNAALSASPFVSAGRVGRSGRDQNEKVLHCYVLLHLCIVLHYGVVLPQSSNCLQLIGLAHMQCTSPATCLRLTGAGPKVGFTIWQYLNFRTRQTQSSLELGRIRRNPQVDGGRRPLRGCYSGE